MLEVTSTETEEKNRQGRQERQGSDAESYHKDTKTQSSHTEFGPCQGGKSPAMKLRSRHLLGIEGLDRSEILTILDQARTFREVLDRTIPIVPALRGRTVVQPLLRSLDPHLDLVQLAASG